MVSSGSFPGPAHRSRAAAGYKRALQVIVLLALATIVALVAYRELTRPAGVQVAAVVVASVREEIIGPGTVQSRYSVSIGARVAGTIDSVLVDVGDAVEKDQRLATLDRTELEARLRVARGAVASAEENIALAAANLAKARSDLDLARIRDERARNLVGADLISVEQADDARATLRAAEAGEGAARAAIDAQEAELARLSDEQRVAETILSYTTLESPMAGVITRRALEPGSIVAPGTVVFQVVDANELWVATLIDQSLAGRVELGLPAVIHLRSGADLSGHVARIAFEADLVTREIEIDVAFDARPARFAINEEADVTILGDEVHGLTVPLEAVRHGAEGNGAYVYVVDDGRVRRQPIRLGIVGARRAQVIEGISEADSVVLAPSTVREGQRVTAEEGE